MEVPKEWKGTPEQWDRVIEAFGNLVVAIREAFKPIVKSFQELYSSLYDVTANPELKRLIKKAKRQQLERSRRRQQLLEANKDKSNNWKRLHGLPAARGKRRKK